MVRKYIRKTDRGMTYTREALMAAVHEVRSKRLNQYAAARIFNVPRSTLHNRLHASRLTVSLGRATAIPHEIEVRLANALKTLQNWGFQLTGQEVTHFVTEFLRLYGLNPPQFKKNVPGKEWLFGFCTRHQLTLYINQKILGDPFVVFAYFALLKKVLEGLNIEDKPQQIWNLTETSMELFQSANKTEKVTLLTAVNAKGDKLSSFLTFMRKQNMEWMVVKKNSCLDDQQPYEVSNKGWTRANVMRCYLIKVFIPGISKENAMSTLILYDGKNTLVDLETVELARRHNITLLKLPSQMTHCLQPLDNIFETLWEDLFVEWQRKNAESKMTTNVFCELVTDICDKTTPEMIRDGFKSAGVHPLDPDAIPIEEYEPNAYKRWIKSKGGSKNKGDPLSTSEKARIYVSRNSLTEHCYDTTEEQYLIETHGADPQAGTSYPETSHFDIKEEPIDCSELILEYAEELMENEDSSDYLK